MPLRQEDFRFLAELMKRTSGLVVTQDRANLILSRLQPVAELHGFADVSHLVADLRYGNEPLTRAVIEAMTIRDTSFFRDSAAFKSFEDTLLPRLLRSRMAKRRIAIWSAACATGQEPYSIAMIFARLPQFAGWDIDILATDVSADAVARAKTGLYTHGEVQRGLPLQMLANHFRPQAKEWRIRSGIRSRVVFRVLNLLDPFVSLGPFDVIFCRNVLMYFDSATKTGILDRLSDTLADDGYLVLGSAETTLGSGSSFASERPGRAITMKAARAQMSRAAAFG
ncbi:MAG TPA: protein-glutamate O-methyltransferase CheR [Micropepsaceae bacterium]|jgi:chemotaxis protein methyltransferase CheR